MLPLLKKKTKAASSAPQMPAWHPSFRNYERLPDIKVVRTVFFVNAVAIGSVLLSFAWVLKVLFTAGALESPSGVWLPTQGAGISARPP